MDTDSHLLIYTRQRPHVEESLLTRQNGQFLWFMIVVNSVFRMKDEIEGEGKKKLFEAFRKYAKDNNNYSQLEKIDTLEQTYDPTKAIEYYSTEPFYYAALNEALRTVDLERVLSYRVLIQDIHKQLQNLYMVSKESTGPCVLKVYRGHTMSLEQIKQLESVQSQSEALIHLKSFTSTSKSYDMAKFYRDAKYDPNNPNQPLVIFEFMLDQQLATRPFADISELSAHQGEDEVLIDIGAVFRVDKVKKEKSGSNWFVRLILLADKDYILHDLLSYMANTKLTDDPRNQLMDFAHLLEDMGEYAKAEQLYRHLQIQYKGDIRAQSACHYGLGVTAQRMGHHAEAIEHGHRCIELQLENELITSPQLIELAKAYNNLGMEKGANGELKAALECLHMSNKIKFHVSKDPEDELMADTYANIGNCYFELGKLNLAEQNLARSVAIRKKHQTPARHPDFIHALMSLGNIYGERQQYERAISQHKEALDLASETLPYYHPLLGMCYLNLAGDYKDSGQFKKAKETYLQAIDIYKHTMSNQHPEMQRAVAHLNEIEQQLKHS